jgi:hypothetical protein
MPALTAVFLILVQCQPQLNCKIQPIVVEGVRFNHIKPFLEVFAISAFLKVIHAPKTPKRGHRGIFGPTNENPENFFFKKFQFFFFNFSKKKILRMFITWTRNI